MHKFVATWYGTESMQSKYADSAEEALDRARMAIHDANMLAMHDGFRGAARVDVINIHDLVARTTQIVPAALGG